MVINSIVNRPNIPFHSIKSLIKPFTIDTNMPSLLSLCFISSSIYPFTVYILLTNKQTFIIEIKLNIILIVIRFFVFFNCKTNTALWINKCIIIHSLFPHSFQKLRLSKDNLYNIISYPFDYSIACI